MPGYISSKTVDETSLSSGSITANGTVNTTLLTANGNFGSSGSRLDNALTHNGVPVVVTLANGVYTGKAGNVTVFTMQINANCSYSFKLYEQLDHADGSNPNDVINLNFGVETCDAKGRTSDEKITICVKDDAPIANNDNRTVDESQTITGNVTSNDNPGQDTPATVSRVTFNGTNYTVPASGNVVIAGAYGTLTINKSGQYSYTAKSNNPDGTDNFTYTLKDRDGDTDTAVLCIDVNPKDDAPIFVKPAVEVVDETNLKNGVITETGSVTANFGTDGPGSFAGNNSFSSSGSRLGNALTCYGTPVVVTFANGVYTGKINNSTTVFTMQINANGSYTFKQYQQLDHADGNNANDIINLNFGVKATDADGDTANTTVTVQVKDDAPIANDDIRNANGGQTITGKLLDNDVVGQDVAGSVTTVVYNGKSYVVPATGNLSINGTYGTLSVNKYGSYTYVAKPTANGKDNFTYTLKDRDGDTDPAVLSVDVKYVKPDVQPIITAPAAEIVDETNLASGTVTESGTVTANFGTDGPGSFSGSGAFSSSGSRLGNALTSNGVAIVVTHANGLYTGKAGNVTVFTFQVGSKGAYSFKLYQQLDHADGRDANDIINLNFGVKATDADGDSATTTVTVKVKDDAPVASNDYCTLPVGAKQLSSNVLTNDKFGQDTPGKLYSVTINGKVHVLPASGSVDLATTYGVLTIAASGAYTYKLGANAPATNVTENFTMTLKDYDGDTATSTLQMNIVNSPLNGGSGNDTLNGTNDANTMNGNGGNDWLYGNGGNDIIHGNAGNDYIDGGLGNDKLYGDDGNDELIGRQGDDIIYGGAGNDDIYGDGGTGDTYAGNDKLYGEAGDDYIFAGAGNDYIDGGSGNDTLYGWTGNDTIIGGTGHDHIIGGAGNDVLTGGGGADTFWYMSKNEGLDRITDFNLAQGDKLELSNVLTNFDPVTDAIGKFLIATYSGGDTTISVNNAGTGASGATQLVVLEDIKVSVSDLYKDGHIIV